MFRIWMETDLDLARGLWSDPQVTKFISANGVFSEVEIRGRLKLEIENETKYGVQYWPVFLKTDQTHVGCCGLRPYDLAGKIYEIGFHIRSAYWGRGLASEAALGVMEYAFKVLKASGLFAGHNPQNTASRHLLQKLGFQYTHDEYYAPTGLQHPSYLLMTDQCHARKICNAGINKD
ncbi:MAG: N-acetyltransferase [Desulfobacteraceae bacterium]|nr:MAG: N-acetyltransferase [Desulfobacteraceae bacterium]